MQNRTDISASAEVVSGSYPARLYIVDELELMHSIAVSSDWKWKRRDTWPETCKGLTRVVCYLEAQAEERRQRRALGLDDKFQMTPRKVSNDTP